MQIPQSVQAGWLFNAGGLQDQNNEQIAFTYWWLWAWECEAYQLEFDSGIAHRGTEAVSLKSSRDTFLLFVKLAFAYSRRRVH